MGKNGWQMRHIVDDDCMFSLSNGFKSGTVCCGAPEGSRFSLQPSTTPGDLTDEFRLSG